MDGQNHVGAVILPGEQRLQPGGLHAALQGCKTLLQLWDQALILEFVAHLAQGHQVIPLLLPPVLSIHLVLEVLDPLLNLLCLGQIIPKAVCGGLSLKHVQFPFRSLQVQRLGQFLQGRGQIVQLYLIFVKLEHFVPTLSV